MFEQIAHWITFFAENPKVFSFFMVLFCLQGLFLIYLFLALFIHRGDRKALERLSISTGVDVLFTYSWRGVELKIRHPTDRSRIPPTQGNPPPSPPLGDWAGKVNLYPGSWRTGVITFEFLLHSTFPKRILSNISHFLWLSLFQVFGESSLIDEIFLLCQCQLNQCY